MYLLMRSRTIGAATRINLEACLLVRVSPHPGKGKTRSSAEMPAASKIERNASSSIATHPAVDSLIGDRKSVVSGKSVSVRVDLGGRRIIKKKKKKQEEKR